MKWFHSASNAENSCPQLSVFPELQLSPDTSAVHYNICVTVCVSAFSMHHNAVWHTGESPSGVVLARLGPLINVQCLIWGTGGRWRTEQERLQVHGRQIKRGQLWDEGHLVWGEGWGGLWCWTSSKFLGQNTLSGQEDDGWRWGGRCHWVFNLVCCEPCSDRLALIEFTTVCLMLSPM